LAERVRTSAVLGSQPITVIPNGIDLDVFKPVDRRIAKRVLNLDPEKRYLLFGAIEATSDSNKGFDLLRETLARFATDPRSSGVEAIILGALEPIYPSDFGIPVHFLGRIRDEISMVIALSAVSVVLVPSRSENLPNMVAEGLACGTPGLTFSVGGCGDLLDHRVNGYLAEPFHIDDYLEGLFWVLDQPEETLREHARDKAEKMLSLAKILEQHMTLYSRVVDR
jgi:glycosyltransferase involved in cell wall biosynthesis